MYTRTKADPRSNKKGGGEGMEADWTCIVVLNKIYMCNHLFPTMWHLYIILFLFPGCLQNIVKEYGNR